MRNRNSIIFAWVLSALMLIVLLSMSACASARAYDPSLPKVSVRKADSEEIKSFGPTFKTNPFLEPATLLGGKKNEFFVVRIDLNLDRPMNVNVDAFAQVPSGGVAPNVLTRYSLIELWEFIDEGARTGDFEKRKTTAEINAIPSLAFSESPGRKRYYLVFSGKFPIKKPVTYHVSVFLSSGESESFQETVAQ